MQLYSNCQDLLDSLKDIVNIEKDSITVLHGERLKEECLDRLLYNAVFNQDKSVKDYAQWAIHACANYMQAIPCTISNLYEDNTNNQMSGRTVPVLYFRGLCYESARATFKLLNQIDSAACMFAVDLSEGQDTDLSAEEYAAVMLTAAMREGFHGPLFFQAAIRIDANNFAKNSTEESERVHQQIKAAIHNGFYNIHMDASVTVDKDQVALLEKYRNNFEQVAMMSLRAREYQPTHIEVNLSAHVGTIGDEHTINRVDEIEAFLDGYESCLRNEAPKARGLSQLSVSIGTVPGGRVLPDGRPQEMNLDWQAFERLQATAIQNYDLNGLILQGVSTLSEETQKQLPYKQVLEAHLSTAHHQLLLNSSHLPEALKHDIIAYLKDAQRGHWREGMTEEQFIHSVSGKCFGPFKKKFWDLSGECKKQLKDEVSNLLGRSFAAFRIAETKRIVREKVRPEVISRPAPLLPNIKNTR